MYEVNHKIKLVSSTSKKEFIFNLKKRVYLPNGVNSTSQQYAW